MSAKRHLRVIGQDDTQRSIDPVERLGRVFQTLYPDVTWDYGVNDEDKSYVHYRSEGGGLNLFLSEVGDTYWLLEDDSAFPLAPQSGKNLPDLAYSVLREVFVRLTRQHDAVFALLL